MVFVRRGYIVWGLAAFLAALVCPARGDERPTLSAAEFEKLHRQLQPPRDEGWQAVPWKLTLLEARKQAVADKKPIFMLVRSGHPLGCV